MPGTTATANWRGKAPVLLTVLTILGLGVWLMVGASAPPSVLPNILPIGHSFDDNPQIPVEEFKTKFDSGLKLFREKEAAARRFRTFQQGAEWVSFLLTSIITIIAGVRGRTPATGDGAEQPADQVIVTVQAELAEEKKKRDHGKAQRKSNLQRLIAFVGVLAALASVFTGIASRLQSQATTSFQSAQELNTALSTARRDWYNGKTKEDALRIIEKLDAELLKSR